jgi:hypothetical protein
MRIMRRVLITTTAVLTLCGFASAATIFETFTPSITSQTTDFLNSVLGVAQFNASWGTLTDISISFSSSFTTTLTVTNSALTTSSGTDQAEVEVFVDDAAFSACSTPVVCVAPNPPLSSNGHFDVGSPLGVQLDYTSSKQAYSLAAGQTTTLASATGSSPTFTIDLNSTTKPSTWLAIVAEFTGTGTTNLDAATYTTTNLANTGGNTSSSQVTTASVIGNVTYTYTLPSSTPEPATLFLMGSALVGVGLFRKRIKL